MRTAICWILFGLALAGLCQPLVGVAAPLGMSYVRQLVAEKNISSVDELLSNLPAYYRSRFTLVFDSRSLQAASYENPRVILYGLNGTFILTFNGDAKHRDRGFDSIEMLEFDEATKQFFLQELRFPQAPDLSSRAEFSEVNPEKCTGCHGKVPRPVWDTHPFWPGVYGELYQIRPPQPEEVGFESFLRHQSVHPRYRYLVGVESFAYRYRFNPSSKDKYDGVHVETPNAELTNLLSGLNAEGIAATVIRHEGFPTYKYALLASLSPSCADIDEFFPAELWPSVRKSHRAFSDRSDSVNQRQLESKKSRARQRLAADRFATESSIDKVQSLKEFRFIVEFALGLDTGDWTLAPEKGTYDFTAPRSAADIIKRRMLDEVARSDPDVEELRVYESQTSNNKYCSYLLRQSRFALDQSKAR